MKACSQKARFGWIACLFLFHQGLAQTTVAPMGAATPLPAANPMLVDSTGNNPLLTPSASNNILQACTKQGLAFQNKMAIFNNDALPVSQRLFIIQNIAGYTVMLDHVRSTYSATANAGWSTKIESGKYAALAMNQPHFAMRCIGYNPPQLGVVDCQSVLSVCAYPQKFSRGNFWVAENMSFDKLMGAIKQRHFIPDNV